jgi:type-F conjugative transfer system pilin assembly protein TrbC
MAQKKLLCILVLLIVQQNIFADELTTCRQKVSAEDIKWISEFTGKEKTAFWQRMQNKATEYFGEEKMINMTNPRPKLQIFVSSSMPKNLLKEYAKESIIYEGALIFKGVIDGKITKFTELIGEILEVNSSAVIQIDDESFTDFGVEQVPTIVLSEQNRLADFVHNKESIVPKYDKVTGNIGIRYALELFSKDGEMKKEAENLLINAAEGY